MILFLGGLLWFGAWWLWAASPGKNVSVEISAQLVVLGSGLATCVGSVIGVVGLLPGNRDRLLALFGVTLNGAGFIFVCRSFLLVGL
jgi:hypothetical protein